MTDLTFRMCAPGDKEQIFRLWEDFIGAHRLAKREELYVWMTERNPGFRGTGTYHVALDGETIVAHYGKMPVEFMVNGRRVHGYVCHDIYVHRRYRGKALGLSDQLVRTLETDSDSFVLALWFAPFNYALHRRCGWRDLPACRSMVKVYDIGPFLASRVRAGALRAPLRLLGNTLLSVRRAACRMRPPAGIIIETVQAFDSRFDSFASEIGGEFGAIAIRDSAYLNWKYADRPHMKYTVVTASEGSALRGYLVYRVERSAGEAKGLIVDFLVSPRRTDVFGALVAAALDDLEARNIDYVVSVTTCLAFRRVLGGQGFVTARSASPMMIANWRGVFTEAELDSPGFWYITRGDGDGDFWTVE